MNVGEECNAHHASGSDHSGPEGARPRVDREGSACLGEQNLVLRNREQVGEAAGKVGS
jgi:hypothetical protein